MKERYFSHDSNARIDPKILKLRVRYGMEGYGIYFAMLEMMSCEADHSMPSTNDQFDAIAYDLHTTVPMGEFVAYCVELGLFVEQDGRFWSESFVRRQTEASEKTARRTETAREAALKRWASGKVKSQAKDEGPSGTHSRQPESIDEGWLRFAQAYEQKIGMLPRDKLDAISDCYDELGEDVMMLALEQTVKAKPEKPAYFLLAILKRWIEDGVDSPQKAKASILDHDRAVEQKKGKAQELPPAPVNVGKFF